jgi:hypothetical protein
VLKKVAAGSHSEKPATNSCGRLISTMVRRARCVTCDTLKGRLTDIDGHKRLMSLIPEESITAMGDEITDLALDGSSIDVAGQSLAGLV